LQQLAQLREPTKTVNAHKEAAHGSK
jgi:hypothetical protein